MIERRPPYSYDSFDEQPTAEHIVHNLRSKRYQIEVALNTLQEAVQGKRADIAVARRDVELLADSLVKEVTDSERELHDDPAALVALQLLLMDIQYIRDQASMI